MAQQDQHAADEKIQKLEEEVAKLREKEAALAAQLAEVPKKPQEDSNASLAQEKLEEEIAKLR